MSNLRVEKRKNESADLFAMRAFAMAMPYMEDKALLAASWWIYDIAAAQVRDRRNKQDRGTTTETP